MSGVSGQSGIVSGVSGKSGQSGIVSGFVLLQRRDEGEIATAFAADEKGVIGFELMRHVHVSLEIVGVEEKLTTELARIRQRLVLLGHVRIQVLRQR